MRTNAPADSWQAGVKVINSKADVQKKPMACTIYTEDFTDIDR